MKKLVTEADDYNSKYIINTYEKMMKDIYPKNRVVFATFATFSRYAGPREAIFTALCRKNFGCSHFIVGRDHTGVGDYYHPKASHQIFDKFPDLGIKPIIFNPSVTGAIPGMITTPVNASNTAAIKPTVIITIITLPNPAANFIMPFGKYVKKTTNMIDMINIGIVLSKTSQKGNPANKDRKSVV